MPDTPATSAEGLRRVLADAGRYSAEYPLLLANHTPMVIYALARLGAPDERLRAYLDHYHATLGLVPPPRPVAPMDRTNWREARGDRSRESDARAFFISEVGRLGIADAVRTYLPELIPGIGASAMHAFMRLAYGVLRADRDEVGIALGYWVCCYLPMPRSTGAAPITADPGEVLVRVGDLPGVHGVVPETDLLWHSIKAVGNAPGFAPVVDWLQIGPDGLARIAATSLALFAATRDFSSLHALTGAHWARLLGDVTPDRAALLRSFWQVIASLVPKIGFPVLPSAETLEGWRRQPCPDWPEIAAAAVRSDDEHDISLCFSAREEEKAYGDRLYRVVAARRMGLID